MHRLVERIRNLAIEFTTLNGVLRVVPVSSSTLPEPM
jgi:hypothetical protein